MIDPRLRGPQASPAPEPEPFPLVQIGAALSIAVALGVMICGGGGSDEAEPEPPALAAQPVLEPSQEASGSSPLVGRDRPEIRHAEAWEKSAEALGVLDRHLNRASLIFQDIDKAEGESRSSDRAMKWRGRGASADAGARPEPADAPTPGPDAVGADGAPIPAPVPAPTPAPTPAGPTPGELEAKSIWASWARDWSRDLEVATKMLPDPGLVDSQLLPGYQAVAQLIGSCRSLPKGDPPSRAARDGWVRQLQNQSVAVRQTLKQAR